MVATVEALCNALAGSRLLTPDAVRALYQRWLREAKESAPDVGRFSRWLVANEVASEYQLGVIARGRGGQLFLDQYKLIDRIGKGRMAGVYKAVHNLGQLVAIKVLPPSKARDPATFARFQREARLARGLEHPNVVRTFQTGDAGGVHYLVMEYLEGETLADVLRRRGKLPQAEAVRVAYQALEGLQHLHEKGMVHRDITPENLMLVGGTADDTHGATVKILDIGTGRALFDEGSPEGGDAFALTNEGDVLGTPEYMAPEQAGDAHGVDIRADLYGLGCVLYHALAGRPPFDDKSKVRLIVRHASETPRPLAEVCRDAPPGLQRVLDKFLAKDPAKRFPTPDAARKALAPFLAEAVSSDFGPAKPEFRAYLDWLKAQGGEGRQAPPPEPGPAAPVPLDVLEGLATSSPGMPSPVAAPPPRQRQAAPPPARPAAAKPSPPRPAAAAPRRPKSPPAADPASVDDVEVVETLLEPGPVEPLSEVPDVERVTVSPAAGRSGGLSGRDLAMIGIGVGVVCILLLATVIVLLLLR